MVRRNVHSPTRMVGAEVARGMGAEVARGGGRTARLMASTVLSQSERIEERMAVPRSLCASMSISVEKKVSCKRAGFERAAPLGGLQRQGTSDAQGAGGAGWTPSDKGQ